MLASVHLLESASFINGHFKLSYKGGQLKSLVSESPYRKGGPVSV